MTPQEIFDTAVGGVLRQGRPSVAWTEIKGFLGCRYRTQGPDGVTLKCAVGQLIPDELYDPDFDEMLGLPSVLIRLAERGRPDLQEHHELLERLQRDHDVCSERPDFLTLYRRNSRETARAYGLSTAVLDEPLAA